VTPSINGLNTASPSPTFKESKLRPTIKIVSVILELALIAFILIWWLTSESVRESKSLWVLFLYCFPAEFIIATVPHEPVLLYFSKFYSPLIIALVSIAATALTETINYSIFRFVADLRLFKKILESKIVKKSVELFQKAPFLALWVAGFTPIPFYPFRFLVVLARYPIYLYILAVITSRTPRFSLLAIGGNAIKISDYLLIVLFIILIAVANIPILQQLLKKLKGTTTQNSAP